MRGSDWSRDQAPTRVVEAVFLGIFPRSAADQNPQNLRFKSPFLAAILEPQHQ